MEFLIDRKFWNLVIKKLTPSTALLFKNCLKKTENKPNFEKGKESIIKQDFVLKLPEGIIQSSFFKENCLNGIGWTGASALQYIEIEKAILKTLIEKQGLSAMVKYKIWGTHEAKYIIDQYEEVSIIPIEKGFVYLIRNDDIYKIGITDNLLRRFNQLKPDEVLNVVRCSNYESLEKELHKKFKDFRIPQTEYFRLSTNQIEQVNIEMAKGAVF